MWANEEVAQFAEELKKLQAPFYGLDVYSLFDSMDAVLSYLKQENPFLARKLAARYACFNSFGRDEIRYAKSLLHYPEGCQAEVLSSLEEMLRARIAEGQRNGYDLFDAQQNARIAKNAEDYYRAMLRGDASSWNVRDQHMQETLEFLLEHHGTDAKAIVWAHNTHIGDYRATDMWSEGYVNLGGLARQRFGSKNVALVGFGTYQGKVIAGHAWGGVEEEMTVPEAMTGSIEECLHIASERLKIRSCYLIFDGKPECETLAQVLGHRAIGVVYDPRHERRGQYVPTALSERYDAFIFVDETTAVHPIGGMIEYGDVPETWPMGQ
jgi:erythromycin esterase-like protein